MSDRLDISQLSCELVFSLRARFTQEELSKKLGFSSNVVYLWESGRRSPEASRFFRLLQICSPDFERVQAAHLQFFSDPSPALIRAKLSTPRGISLLVRELVGSAPLSPLARKIEVDRSTLARWVKGKTEPRLPDLLRLVQATTQRLLVYVSCFVEPKQVPSIQSALLDLEEQQRLAYERPWSHAVLRVLELHQYSQLDKHSDAFVADYLGLEEREAKALISALADSGQIVMSQGRWKIGHVLTVDTREDADKNRKLKSHWAQVALERLDKGAHREEALFSYNLFAVSKDKLEKIRSLHLAYYDAVRALVDESEQADEVVLLNAQLVPLRPVHDSCSK